MKNTARKIFLRTLAAIDAERVVRHAFTSIDDLKIDPSTYKKIIVISIGKAAAPMAQAVEEILGDKITAGLIVTNASSHHHKLPVIIAGHPVPNAASIDAASRALAILSEHDSEETLALFLISGGGSALFEKPIDESISLEELRQVNETLVGCGAVISEMNKIRRRISAVKGGGLAAAAPKSRQISLYISDVNSDDLQTIASGPTMPQVDVAGIDDIINRYDLHNKFSESINRVITNNQTQNITLDESRCSHHLLMDNTHALLEAQRIARNDFNLITEIADDLIEGDVDYLAALHIERIINLKNKYPDRNVCLISGGEAICPIVGNGKGGRNQELVLRSAIKLAESNETSIVVLSAGTDGIDGRSPAAGAVADNSTIEHAQKLGLDAVAFLNNSDSYSFFDRLSDTIITGPTNNNVRDIRLLIC